MGWKENNLSKIVSVLSSDCVIIDSHGPTYTGLPMIEQWVELWAKDGGSVLQWDITSSCHAEQASFFEWEFRCDVNGKEYFLPGISVVKFSTNVISFIHEYRMTKNAYLWNKNVLVSE